MGNQVILKVIISSEWRKEIKNIAQKYDESRPENNLWSVFKFCSMKIHDELQSLHAPAIGEQLITLKGFSLGESELLFEVA